MTISIIAAISKNNVIGAANNIPWCLPSDMKFFKDTTMGHYVVTGRKNYESIPERFRPLPGRKNIVVTRQKDYDAPGATVVNSLSEAFRHAYMDGASEVFVIGGGEIYKQALDGFSIDRMYLTEVDAIVEGDVFFPAVDMKEWKKVNTFDVVPNEKDQYNFTIAEYVEQG